VTPAVNPRIALCHEWITTLGGSEQTVQRIAHALDITDIYTFAADTALVNRLFPGSHVRSSRIGRSSFAITHWQWLLPLMDRWWKHLDFQGYACVVTSSHAAVNAVRTQDDVPLVSYCYTPMRYAWRWQEELGRFPAPLRFVWPAVASMLRRSDRRRAHNVDLFIAISRNVARRIEDSYGRASIVIYPPVDTEFFSPDASIARGDFFLLAGRFVAYKRAHVAVRAATVAGIPLVAAGSGPDLPRAKRIAGPMVEFLEQPTDEELRDLYRRARALVFPGVEDFGIIPVEAQACGTPVIAFAEGGVRESVRDGVTGVLYSDPSVEGLAQAMRTFDESRYNRDAIRKNALRFSADRFDTEIRELVTTLLDTPPDKRAELVERLLEEAGSAQ
jgi:glycosyltransferase involved in cell wall biosynthesis